MAIIEVKTGNIVVSSNSGGVLGPDIQFTSPVTLFRTISAVQSGQTFIIGGANNPPWYDNNVPPKHNGYVVESGEIKLNITNLNQIRIVVNQFSGAQIGYFGTD